MLKSFAKKVDAKHFLKGLGMTLNYSAGGREYWHYGDGSDKFLDHSATVDHIGNAYYLSVYDRKENEDAKVLQ